VVVALELMVSVEATALVPEIAAGWLTVQVGEAVAPAGPFETAHVNATLPVNPPLGVMVRFDVADPPGAKALMALPLIANEGIVSVYAAVPTLLVPRVGLMAMALIVSVVPTAIGLAYLFE
jgi:hypothetical protein